MLAFAGCIISIPNLIAWFHRCCYMKFPSNAPPPSLLPLTPFASGRYKVALNKHVLNLRFDFMQIKPFGRLENKSIPSLISAWQRVGNPR